MVKKCPKCKIEHQKPGIFCSRACANSREWDDADKKKKSDSNKNSQKVKEENGSSEKREKLKRSAKKQHAEGRGVPPSDKARKNAKLSYIKNQKERRSSLDLSVKTNYRKLCKFSFNLADYEEEFDFSLIEQFGWYTAANKGNNAEGISRDHMLSISDGWKQGIDPEKIRHPANCRLMQQKYNLAKKGKSVITESQLDEKINEWTKKYGKYNEG